MSKQKQIVKKFKARKGSQLSDTQANLYGEEMERLQKQLDTEILAPEEIVEDAKNKNTAYHDYFVWDDSVAGQEFRLHQARVMSASIVEVKIIESMEKPVEVRSFVNVVYEGKKGYARREFALSHEETAQQVIQKALREARAWAERYKVYSELAGIRKAIEKTVAMHEKNNELVG